MATLEEIKKGLNIAKQTALDIQSRLGTITPADLEPQEEIKLPNPPTVEDTSGLASSALASSNYNPLTKVTEETDSKKALDKALEGIEPPESFSEEYKKAFESPEQKAQESKVQELRGQLAGLQAQQQALQAEYNLVPSKIQEEFAGRGVTAGGIAPIQAEELRKIALKQLPITQQILTTSAILAGEQGKLDTAREHITNLLNLQQKDRTAIREYKLDVISRLENIVEGEQKERLEKKKAEEEKLTKIEEREYNIKKNISDAYIKSGDIKTATLIANAKTQEEIETIVSKNPLQINKTEMLKTKALEIDIATKEEKLRQLRSKPSVTIEDIKQKSTAEYDALQGKIDLIDKISSHPGLDSRVGPGVLSRGFFGIFDAFGAGDSFAGDVHLLTSSETLQNLIDAKSRGATFGALSNQELGLLIESATKIGGWEKKDKNGIGTGVWDVSEKDFRVELDRIKKLAIKAQQGFLDDIISQEDESELDLYFSPPFNPSNFY